MEIARCPSCGESISEEDMISDQVRLAFNVGMLVGAAAVTGMMVTLPDYAAARDGYDERLKEVTNEIAEHTEAFVMWGESYDST